MGVAICEFCGSPEYACWCEEVRERMAQYYDEDEIDKFWFSPNSMLIGETPAEVARTGKPTDIMRVAGMLIGEMML
jgi:hypothetical protein